MNAPLIEQTLKVDVELIFLEIVKSANYALDLPVRSRVGAEISDYLEDAFIEHVQRSKHPRIVSPTTASKTQTKSPYDLEFTYRWTEPDPKRQVRTTASSEPCHPRGISNQRTIS